MNQRPATSSPTNTSNNDTISPGEVSITPCDNTRPNELTHQNEWQIVSKRKKKKKSKTQKQRNDEARSNSNDWEDSVPEKVSTTVDWRLYDKKYPRYKVRSSRWPLSSG